MWTESGDADEPFVFAPTGEASAHHPLTPAYQQLVRAFGQKQPKALIAQAQVDTLGWMLFVASDDKPFFYNFVSGQFQPHFPELTEVRSCALLRAGTISSKVSAQRGRLHSYLASRDYIQQMLVSRVTDAVALEASSIAVRAAALRLEPALLSQLLMMAQYLGLSPTTEGRWVWIAHLAMCLDVPAGWERHQVSNEARDGSFYFNALLGLSQWEPPQWSYCRGVLQALRDATPPNDAPSAVEAASTQEAVLAKAAALRDAAGRGACVTHYITPLAGAKRYTAKDGVQIVGRADGTERDGSRNPVAIRAVRQPDHVVQS